MQILKDFRKKRGFSREQMADLLNISLSLYNSVEYGIRQPSRKFLISFKRAFPDFDMNIFFSKLYAKSIGDETNGKSDSGI